MCATNLYLHMPMQVHVLWVYEQRTEVEYLLLSLSASLFEIGHLSHMELTIFTGRSVRVSDPLVSHPCLHPVLELWIRTWFLGGVKDPEVFILIQQIFYPLSHSPALPPCLSVDVVSFLSFSQQ